MTRPIGKSPARVRTFKYQPNVEQTSLIELGNEDDSLLTEGVTPGKPSPMTRSRAVAPSPFKNFGPRTLPSIKEDLSNSDDLQESSDDHDDITLPRVTQEPAIGNNKKKKKTGFNLRKSLAWNNAFFTEEGVLDPEELALVNQTFIKPAESKPVNNKKAALASKLLKPSVIPKINFSPLRPQKTVSHVDKKLNTSPMSKSSSRRGDVNTDNAKGFTGNRYQSAPSRFQHGSTKADTYFAGNVAQSHEHHRSPLKNGSPLSVNRSPKMLPHQLSNVQSLTNTISSASKKMKDRIGMVLSGLSLGSPRGVPPMIPKDDSVVTTHNMRNGISDNAKLTRCYSHMSHQRFVPSSSPNSSINSNNDSTGTNTSVSSVKEFSFPSLEQKSHVNNTYQEQMSTLNKGIVSFCQPGHQQVPINAPNNETSGSNSFLSRAKPSGLRMPSPKIGFFEKPKAHNPPQLIAHRETTNSSPSKNVGIPQNPSRLSDPKGVTNDHGDVPSSNCKVIVGGGHAVAPQNGKSSGTLSIERNAGQSSHLPLKVVPRQSNEKRSSIEHGDMPASNNNNNNKVTAFDVHMSSESNSSFNNQLSHKTVVRQRDLKVATAEHLDIAGYNNKLPAGGGHHIPPQNVRSLPGSRSVSPENNSYSKPTFLKPPVSISYKSSTHSKPSSFVNGCSLTSRLPGPTTTTTTTCQPSLSKSNGISSKNSTLPVVTGSTMVCKINEKITPVVNPLQPAADGTDSKLCQTSPDSKINDKIVQKSSQIKTDDKVVGLPLKAEDKDKSPTVGNVLQVKKNALNVLPGTKKNSIPRLIVPSRNPSGQENECRQQNVESSKSIAVDTTSYDDSGAKAIVPEYEEWPIQKTGAVQHSPQNKEAPPPGPWSPIKRNGQQIGPFDCTKYTNIGIAH